MSCTVKTLEDGSGKTLSLLLRLDDKMNRQLNCKVTENESAIDLANELVRYGLVNEVSFFLIFVHSINAYTCLHLLLNTHTNTSKKKNK